MQNPDERPAGRRLHTVGVPIASAIIALYAIEAVFTFASPAWLDSLGTALRRGPSLIAETIHLRALHIPSYPYLQPDIFTDSGRTGLAIAPNKTVVPLAGIASEMTVLCNETGTTIAYRSDSLGYRNPGHTWKRDGSNIAIVGDSFAQGFCRPEGETIAALLRKGGYPAVTTGLAGAGPLTELGIIREYLAPYRPHVVYWLLYEGNDVVDLASERKTILGRYVEPGFTQNLLSSRAAINSAMRAFADSLMAAYRRPTRLQRAWGFISMRNLRTATGLYRRPQLQDRHDESADLALLRVVLAQADRDVRGWGGQLRLVYLPERRRFDLKLVPTAGENHDPHAVEAAVRRDVKELGIPFINVADIFARDSSPKTLWRARRLHYNARGYATVARSIISDLETRAAASTPSSPCSPAKGDSCKVAH